MFVSCLTIISYFVYVDVCASVQPSQIGSFNNASKDKNAVIFVAFTIVYMYESEAMICQYHFSTLANVVYGTDSRTQVENS